VRDGNERGTQQGTTARTFSELTRIVNVHALSCGVNNDIVFPIEREKEDFSSPR